MTNHIFGCVAVMAGVTYLIRAVPLVLIRQKLQNRWIRSFLYYIPYAVLASMTVPSVFFSTDSVISAVAGVAIALLLAFLERGLVTVALCACAGAIAVQGISALL